MDWQFFVRMVGMRRKALMNTRNRALGGLLFAVLVSGCIDCGKKEDTSKPLSSQVVAGRYLFFDKRLSFNNTKSCSSCHDPQFAFTDGYRRSTTATGDIVLHNAPSLINCASMRVYDWANPAATTLEVQHERPLFSKHPIELGVSGYESEIIKRLETDSRYPALFASAFPGEQKPIQFTTVIASLAAYVRTLESRNSAYDRYEAGDLAAMSASAKMGRDLFFSSRLNCVSCHQPPDFTIATRSRRTDSIYVNIGLYSVGGKSIYPNGDNGLRSLSALDSDDGRFRIPSLRNATLTAPYFHDGSVASLEEVIDIYSSGGRNVRSGPYAGNGALNSYKDSRIKGFSISKQEKDALIDFLYALSDSAVLKNPHFQNPFRNQNDGRAYNR